MNADLLARIAKALEADCEPDGWIATAKKLLPECAAALKIAVEALRTIAENEVSPVSAHRAREALSRLASAAEKSEVDREVAYVHGDESGWVRIGRYDSARRRSLWCRLVGEDDIGNVQAIELCSGREGDDAYVKLTSADPQWDDLCNLLLARRGRLRTPRPAIGRGEVMGFPNAGKCSVCGWLRGIVALTTTEGEEPLGNIVVKTMCPQCGAVHMHPRIDGADAAELQAHIVRAKG